MWVNSNLNPWCVCRLSSEKLLKTLGPSAATLRICKYLHYSVSKKPLFEFQIIIYSWRWPSQFTLITWPMVHTMRRKDRIVYAGGGSYVGRGSWRACNCIDRWRGKSRNSVFVFHFLAELSSWRILLWQLCPSLPSFFFPNQWSHHHVEKLPTSWLSVVEVAFCWGFQATF